MKHIPVSQKVNDSVVTRNSVIDLFKEIEAISDNSICLDFNNITFISRSSMDEYFKSKNKSNKDIKEINMSDDLKAMFKIVQIQNQEALCNKMSGPSSICAVQTMFL